MGIFLVLAFIGIPILEIAVFIQAGQLIGLWPTVAGVVLTAVIGAALVRHQGLSTIIKAQESVNAGRFPVAEVFDGLCLVLAGAFLITPGFVTDTFGFLLLVPALRAVLRRAIGRYMVASGRVTMWTEAPPEEPFAQRAQPQGRTGPVIIEADYEDVTDEGGEDADRRDDGRHEGGGSTPESSPWNRGADRR